MTIKNALIYRIGTGKAIGLVFGLLGFFLLPLFVSEPSLLLRVGLLFWYPTLGAIIGMFGAFSYHPVLRFPMPWWCRGPLLGAWMNFVLALIAYEQVNAVTIAIFGEHGVYMPVFLMALEGAVIGLLMDYLLTRWFGEGRVGNDG